MKRQSPEDLERLLAVLDEWGPQPEPTPGFGAALRRRIAQATAPRPRHWLSLPAWSRWPVWSAAGVAAAALALVVYWGQPSPPATPVVQAAVVQDLQLWNHNAELIENLDFLTAPSPAVKEEQN